jgi:hypothetical protein
MSDRLNETWRAFYGLTESRHQRLVLIECIETAAKESFAQEGVASPTELAHYLYALQFPEAALKVDKAKLEVAIVAWNNPPGRPKGGATRQPKWEAINAVAVSAGIASAAPNSIQREWEKYAAEVRSGKPPG